MRAGETGNWGPRLDNKTKRTGEELWESSQTFFEPTVVGKTSPRPGLSLGFWPCSTDQ